MEEHLGINMCSYPVMIRNNSTCIIPEESELWIQYSVPDSCPASYGISFSVLAETELLRNTRWAFQFLLGSRPRKDRRRQDARVFNT